MSQDQITMGNALDSSVREITQMVCSTMLGWEAEATDDATSQVLAREAAQNPAVPTRLTSLVNITGTFEGAVTFDCDVPTARRITSAMLGTDADAATPQEIQDAMGEMANMIGGNFKSTLTPPVSLSLPTVIEGHGYAMNILHSTILSRQAFKVGNDELVVTIRCREPRTG